MADRTFENNFTQDVVKIMEGSFDGDYTNGKIKIIEEGFNVNKNRYYTKEAIQNDIKKFEGVKMFINHEDDKDTAKRGARDLRDWVATVKTTEAGQDENGKYAGYGNVIVHKQSFRDFLKEAKESGVLSEVGASINAFCRGVRRKMDNVYTNVIEGFPRPLSVDFVSAAGAGGKVINYRESINEGDEDMDWEKVTAEEVKESAPKLFAELEKSIKESAQADFDKKLKEELAKAKESEDKTEDKPDTDESKFNVREARLDRKELVSSILLANSLPASAKERVKESLLNQEVILKGDKLDIEKTKESITKVIESEEAYIKAFQEASVTGNGSSDKEDSEDTEKAKEAELWAKAFDDQYNPAEEGGEK